MTYDKAVESAVTQFNALYPGLGDFFREENGKLPAEDVVELKEYLGRQKFADSHFTPGFFIAWLLPNGPPNPHDYFWDALQELCYSVEEPDTLPRGQVEELLKEFSDTAHAIKAASVGDEAEAFLL